MESAYEVNMGPLGYVSKEMCNVIVLRGSTRISITVNFARVEDKSFGEELLEQVQNWKMSGSGSPQQKPVIDLVWQYCLPLITQLAPQTSLQDLSLEGFLRCPNYNIEVVKGDKDGVDFEGLTECTYEPAFFTSPMRTVDLPDSCKTIPCILAKHVYIAPILCRGEKVDATQGRIVTAEGSEFYFKPRMDMREVDFERELQILSHIRSLGAQGPARMANLRIPTLEGIVVSGSDTIGMLLTLVDGTHLRSPEHIVRRDLHDRWKGQLEATVQELHAHNLVWGDVHPMNIIIDKDANAWAIDFGGMNNVEFVDDDKRETVEGDLQGLSRIFDTWLPRHYHKKVLMQGT